MAFDDQVFIVSGGACGMGPATATLLAHGGPNFIIADIDAEAGHPGRGIDRPEHSVA